MFDRAAYGCRLFCCWCAQDIAANYFWESLGFIPLAYRAGSREKGRVHIFWQRRIRPGDTTTPYWFPSQTNSGSIREDRLVLPIPPGTHWSDARPLILPALSAGEEPGAASDEGKQLPTPRQKKPKNPPTPQPTTIASGGLRFVVVPEVAPPPIKAKRQPRQKVKNDPRLIAAARELRDRWLERVNANPGSPGLISRGKYDVSRAISRASAEVGGVVNALPAPLAA